MALGRQLIIARDNGSGGHDAICVTEARSLEINNEEVDITKPNCASPGSKLAYAAMYGIQTVRVQGAGAFVSNTAMSGAIADSVSQVVKEYEIDVPGVGTFVGDALISITFSGDKTGELQADIRLTMSGTVTFTAV